LKKIKTGMSVKVIPIQAGLGQVFLVKQGDHAFLVDAGNKGYEKKILKTLSTHKVDPKSLLFIFITHAHYDHAGSAAALKKATGAPVITHEKEAHFLKQGFQPLPKGTAPFYKTLISLGKKMGKIFSGFPPLTADITFKQDYDLKTLFDIDGKILHTPGHTMGSSVLIIDQFVFVGDTLFNLWNGTVYPLFADNEALLKESWRMLLNLEQKYFYPAHGKRLDHRAFHREAIKKHII
jgi:glyoxylase-like metal-dependent hydrolase (beta-lactamase superfamily II)